MTAETADTILAALSPEAPAREGVAKACAEFQEAIDYFEADVADALAEDSERADLWDREVTVNIDALKTVMQAALTPRHEAPAEGAGEVLALADRLDADAAYFGDLSAANSPGWKQTLKDLRSAAKHLRARSSAPEAREGYPSRAWGCVARLSDNTPWEAFAATEDQPDPAGAWSEIISLYTHPAAPSADKLQDALKETWDALTALREAFALDGVYDGPKGKALRLSNAAIRSAASALKTEGAK